MKESRSSGRHGVQALGAGLVLAAVLAGVLSGCGSDPDDGGTFATGDESAYPLTCMEHQAQKPGSAYTGGDKAGTAQVLKMLRYYTANRGVADFCDGKPATATDRAWAQLYVDLGSEPANVVRLLG